MCPGSGCDGENPFVWGTAGNSWWAAAGRWPTAQITPEEKQSAISGHFQVQELKIQVHACSFYRKSNVRVWKFLNREKIMTNELLIIIYLALNIHAKIYKYVKLHINFLGLFFSGAKVNQERPLTTVLGTRWNGCPSGTAQASRHPGLKHKINEK